MTTNRHPQLVTPESIAAYVGDPAPECADFDFLIGAWDAEATRWAPNGDVVLRHRVDWVARYAGQSRMIIDECTGFLSDGGEISHMATLRTYAPTTQRWEMTFLTAHQPPVVRAFHGRRRGDEMHLTFEGRTPAGESVAARVRFFDIRPSSFSWEQELAFGGETFRDVRIEARRRDTGAA